MNSFVHKLAFVVWAKFVSFFCFLFNWDSFHARLNSHYKTWSHKKKKHKKIKAYSKSFLKGPRVNSYFLILDLKRFRS